MALNNHPFGARANVDGADRLDPPGDSAFFSMRSQFGRGDADRLDFEGKNQFRLTNASYTTCKPDNDDWYAKASVCRLLLSNRLKVKVMAFCLRAKTNSDPGWTKKKNFQVHCLANLGIMSGVRILNTALIT